jgi:pyruvate dehydrogenase E2 component (dihydrolipoamide acetyltransferase)
MCGTALVTLLHSSGQYDQVSRSGRLQPDELQGATFRIADLGEYGVHAFTPIIQWLQCAALGVGHIAPKAAVWQGQIVPRYRMTLGLAFDHRVVDGPPAGQSLETVREYVERPAA